MSVADLIKLYRENPTEFVKREFNVTPDEWQADALNAFVSNDPLKQRISMQACAGPGKSTVMAWIGWLFLLCYAEKGNHPKAAAVSITGDNLRDNLWSEMSKWQDRSALLTAAFTWTQSRIFAKDHPNTWFMSARSFPKSANAEEIGRTLSGLHSKFVLYLIDESGDIPVSIIKSAEQGLSTGPVFGKIVQAGNPTSHSGMLYAAATKLRSNWHVIRITGDPDDPKRSPRISIEWARDQIRLFGRNNPWVKSFILGEFPDSAVNTLLTMTDVEKSVEKGLRLEHYSFAQKRMGVDVARSGSDKTVIFPRQGLRVFKPVVMMGAKTDEIAARILHARQKWVCDQIFVDGTGGFGAGVVDFLKSSGTHAHEIHFSGKPIDSQFLNKRSEIWFNMAESIKSGLSIPDDPELIRELVSVQYTIVNGKLQLEPKEYVKKRLGYSPDCFVEGTLIKTDKGLIPIEKLKNGDIVFTPLGSQKIIKVWESYTNELTIASFSNGQILAGKGTHGIFTWNKGFVKMSEIQKDSCIESVSKVSILKWEILNLLFTKKKNIIFKQAVDITQKGTSQSPIKSELDFYTDGFGLSTMVLFLKVFTFIILMVIGAITALRTLKQFVVESISLVICLVGLLIKTIKRILLKFLMMQGILQTSGTEAVKDLSGISFMVKKHGKIEKQKNRFVMYAERFIRLIFQVGQNFVQSLVSKSKDIKTKQKQLFANYAEQKKKFINMGRGNSVLISVLQKPACVTKVYNLTLENHNVYYANGILVANCADALALTFSLPDMPAQLANHGLSVGKLKTDPD